MKIRLFVSHSTWNKPNLNEQLRSQVAAHAEFRDSFCELLRASQKPQIDVLIDADIEIGRPWHDLLFDAIADCSAAVVLVNEQALAHSEWIDAEISVLGYRAYHERDSFRLFVVPFGGVNIEKISQKSSWKPVSLCRLHMKPRCGLDETKPEQVHELIQEIILTLQELPDSANSGWLVSRLCALLPKEDAALKELAHKLVIDTRGIGKQSEIDRRIAHKLYQLGPLAIRSIATCTSIPATWDASSMLAVLGTYWINIAASVGILASCNGTLPSKAVAINSSFENHTPLMYVRQVCGTIHCWPIVVVDPSHEVTTQIRTTLIGYKSFISAIKRKEYSIDFNDESRVDKHLNELMSLPDAVPVFVTFLQMGGGNVTDVVDCIHNAFPSINVIVCTGPKSATTLIPPEITMLTPEIDPAQESMEIDNYRSMETHLWSTAYGN